MSVSTLEDGTWAAIGCVPLFFSLVSRFGGGTKDIDTILERGSVVSLALVEPLSRFEDKPVEFQVVCPQNGTAVLRGLHLIFTNPPEENNAQKQTRMYVVRTHG